eukprot:CAMPEP_0194176794 /NCGR_PEP_ID=MMETSP0154-20130528/10662_1 /TAXON_ID=1049557 /ORGANISM="Thalassiothrix antarctica, Strain L6-D1" /LENGTH=124 /DNA_ID=CAMNT_0038891121 /DNA_START=264 /DNA_END=636 /DNA_ORIENTATION=-
MIGIHLQSHSKLLHLVLPPPSNATPFEIVASLVPSTIVAPVARHPVPPPPPSSSLELDLEPKSLGDGLRRTYSKTYDPIDIVASCQEFQGLIGMNQDKGYISQGCSSYGTRHFDGIDISISISI